jgi:hypothetical protein
VVVDALVVPRALVGAAGGCGPSVPLAGGGRVRTGEQHRDDQTSNDQDLSHGFSSSRREVVLSAGMS